MRTQLFIPITLSLILIPMLIWRMFSFTSVNYMYRTSLDQLNHLVYEVASIANQSFSSTIPSDEKSEPKKVIKHFYQHLTELLTTERSSAQFIILDDSFNVIYPTENFEQQKNSYNIYNYYVGTFDDNFALPDNNINELHIDNQNFLVSFQEISITDGSESKYLIGYVPVDDIGNLLNHAKSLMLLISIILSSACLIILWFLIGTIIKPIKKLCKHTSRIGNGDFVTITESSNITEISQLNTAVNEMVQELKHSDESQKIFFQNVSHDLRTPLMSIGGYAQGIQCGIFEDNSRAIKVIADESKRLTELVDGILTLSRMDSNRQAVHLHPINLKDFFKLLFLRLDGIAVANNISLAYTENVSSSSSTHTASPRNYTIIADDELMNRVFSNILSNCIRYAEHIVNIEVIKAVDYVDIFVKDDGPGFSVEDTSHLFERFYKGAHGNFGIGLAIAKSATEYMGATIVAYNDDAIGATFKIRFLL